MPRVICLLCLASNPNVLSAPGSLVYHINAHEIGLYGALYTGTLIRHLGEHYENYVSTTNIMVWHIHNTYGGGNVGVIRVHDDKHRSSAVTGNLGEAIVMPALASCLGLTTRTLAFQRIKSRVKCPDFRMSCDWPRILSAWCVPYVPSSLPDDMPVEVKSHLDNEDQYYPLEALEQLKSYWEQCDQNGYARAVGFGMIARVSLDIERINRSGDHFIRYTLFVPNSRFSLWRLSLMFKVMRKHKARLNRLRNGTVWRWIGRLFV